MKPGLIAAVVLLVGACGPQTKTQTTTVAANGERAIGGPDEDADGDRILNGVDKCPLDAEDYDGFEDEDGCPEFDNDFDGVLDNDDDCPYTPGKDGKACPESCTHTYAKHNCKAAPIEAAAVAATLTTYPEIYEITLYAPQFVNEAPATTEARVAAVRDQLIASGVTPTKLAIRVGAVTQDQSASQLVYAKITRQRFTLGKFRASVCTPAGEVNQVKRQEYFCPNTPY